jgi:hypothetical protein
MNGGQQVVQVKSYIETSRNLFSIIQNNDARTIQCRSLYISVAKVVCLHLVLKIVHWSTIESIRTETLARHHMSHLRLLLEENVLLGKRHREHR